MPDWLRDATMMETPIDAATMALRLTLAAAFGVVIAGLYRLSHGRLARDSRTLMGTLVLLTILLAMVTMVIGESVARAFGLVGALSIVRFRTVVEDTRDTAFVIFGVVVGMAIGTGLVLVAAIGTPIVGVAALAASARLRRATQPGATGAGTLYTITVRLGAGQSAESVGAFLRTRTRTSRLAGVSTARQGASLDLTYAIELASPDEGPALVLGMNSVAGVQGVDLQHGTPAP